MDITLFVINTVICAIFWLLSRLCCAWIGHLCEASAGQIRYTLYPRGEGTSAMRTG